MYILISGCRSPDPVCRRLQIHTHSWDTRSWTHLHVGSGSVTGGKSIYLSISQLRFWCLGGQLVNYSLDSYGLCLVHHALSPLAPHLIHRSRENRIAFSSIQPTLVFLLRWLLQKSSSAATVIKNYIPYTNRFHPVLWSFFRGFLHAAHIFFYGHPFLLLSGRRNHKKRLPPWMQGNLPYREPNPTEIQARISDCPGDCVQHALGCHKSCHFMTYLCAGKTQLTKGKELTTPSLRHLMAEIDLMIN